MLVCGYYVPPKISIKFYSSPMWWANAVIISALWMDKLRVKSVQGQKNSGPKSERGILAFI